ncbi:MAG: helix-turn-helix transcriptional regulator [Clostridia bacterium]|nr:helix-turn-helix transcriptional regulator [Clostridia bacterium]
MKQISLTESQPEILKILKVRSASMEKGGTYENKVGRPGECLICVIKGEADYRTERGDLFNLKKGSVLFLSREITYSMKVKSDGYDFIFVEFKFSSEPYEIKNEHFQVEGAEKLFRQLIETDVKKLHGRKISCLSILYMIYDLLISSSVPQESASFKHAQIERIAYEIQQKFRNPDYSVYLAAKKTNMSEAYFRKLFRSEYGMCPVEYLISLRIAHAKNLLTYQKSSISEIALESGFSDIYYFSRRFKKETGMTPTEYRRYINSY